MYNPDITDTESWLREEMGNTEIFRTDFTMFRRDRHTWGGGVFICIKNNITCSELWVDDQFEILAVEVKGRDPNFTWEIVSSYRSPNDDIRAIEKLAAQTELVGNFKKRSILGGNLNLPHVDWKRGATQAVINRLVWDKGYTQVVEKLTRGDSLPDVYLVRLESELVSCDTVQGISDHCRVLLEIEWGEKSSVTLEKCLVPAYHKTNILGLQAFLQEKYSFWANNSSCIEDIWKNFKDVIFEGINRLVLLKVLKQNPDPEYYNKEVKHLKAKVRRVYSKRKLGEHYHLELKRLSKKLLAVKRSTQETFLSSVLQNERKSLLEFYRYIRRRKGHGKHP
jgi:hypothetical protein